MISSSIDRRLFALGAGAMGAGGLAAGLSGASKARAATEPDFGISTGNAAIHQEVVFKASPARVYRTLTDAAAFDRVVVLSGAIQTMQLSAAPTRIEEGEGGAFSLFGGYITGRHVELAPGERLIQAWRSQSWAPHIYSIARFELAAHPDGARLVFDQTGFPNDEAQSLAHGWREHYWEPLAKALA